LSHDAAHPVILSNKGPFTQLIIDEAHERVHHAKTERTLSEVLSKFWVIKGRRTVRAFVERCSICRRESSRPVQPLMAALPADRLRPFLPPFTHVGVDYFGPLFVVVGRHVEKRYGCLFMCMTTRAVHIELSTKMDADSLLMAFRCFVARRGTPRKIYSDNGTNFVAGKKELEQGATRMAEQQEFSRRGQLISIHSATRDDLAAEENELR
jgi:transposase